jgi:hypothetical protein
MELTNLTFEQLKQILKENKYILLYERNWCFPKTVNCAAALVYEKRTKYNPLDYSIFSHFVPIDLNELICNKDPNSFVKK